MQSSNPTTHVPSLTNTAMQQVARVLHANGIDIYGTRYPEMRRLIQAGISAVVADHQMEQNIAKYVIARARTA